MTAATRKMVSEQSIVEHTVDAECVFAEALCDNVNELQSQVTATSYNRITELLREIYAITRSNIGMAYLVTFLGVLALPEITGFGRIAVCAETV